MSRQLLLLYMVILCTGTLWAQNQPPKPVTAAQTIQKNNYTIQVGIPFLGIKDSVYISGADTLSVRIRKTDTLDIRFPWDVLYLRSTFSYSNFEVSKGYFGDKIRISWLVRNNQSLIDVFKVYRRVYDPSNTDAVYEQIASAAPDATEYEDKYVEGGVLYEYKIFASGISNEKTELTNFVTGIGYRNPTAIVTGNISFKGGNPVKGVSVYASPQGGDLSFGHAIKLKDSGLIASKLGDKEITTKTTLQAWLKPVTDFSGTEKIKLFSLTGSTNLDVFVKLNDDASLLTVSIGALGDFTLGNGYPAGKLDARGDEIIEALSKFNEEFVHFSVVLENGKIPLLYINGKPISEDFQNLLNENIQEINEKIVFTAPSSNFATGSWEEVRFGGIGSKEFIIDEIRVWDNILDDKTIGQDFKRYIGGNHKDLALYLRLDEGTGTYAYDLSKYGFSFNKNHAELIDDTEWVGEGEGDTPTSTQFGVIGITDLNGNYEISAIPYSGTGESYEITPLFGQHEFEPNQQLVFLGQGAEVVNKINFTDISSFDFIGRVLYDTRNIFPPIVMQDKLGPGINEEGYNTFTNTSGEKFAKGEYWLNPNGDDLDVYARIGSEGANIFIDGEIVIDSNNRPVLTDENGEFEISVPIGNHYITIAKGGHFFTHSGRFPADENDLFEFFEDSNEEVNFIDETKVTIVGKVVGGSVEAQKIIGFGQNGIRDTILIKNDLEDKIRISAKNNIGTAKLTLGYKPPTGNITPGTTTDFETHIETGEYRVKLLPLKYTLAQIGGLQIESNTAIISSIVENDEELDFREIPDSTTPVYNITASDTITGLAYHYEKSFVYRSTPVLKVIKQSSEDKITIGEDEFVTTGLKVDNKDVLVYKQFGTYKVEMKSFEPYVNKDDNSAHVHDTVPIIDGIPLITNNLALANSESFSIDSINKSKYTYTFKGGLPTVSKPFTKSLDIKFRINEVDYEATDYIKENILLGGASDGSQTFVTAAPDIPDIILRDPPGSNSFASIEEGQSISFSNSSSLAHDETIGTDTTIKTGMKVETGGGLAGPVISSESKNDFTLGISTTLSSEDGESSTKTYTFSQTISTSDDPDFVGAEGDLYIGQSKNYFYGAFDNVTSAIDSIRGTADLKLTNSEGAIFYITKEKAMTFVEEPSNTFFVYSQKHILETLIPSLEEIIDNIDKGVISENDEGVLPRVQYVQQVNLWRKVIRNNERKKYLAINDRANLKQETIGAPIPLFANSFYRYLDENFEDNISFDAGVGEFTRSVESAVLVSETHEFDVELNESFKSDIGVILQGATGMVLSPSTSLSQTISETESKEEINTTLISYTLKDNDEANFFSVDVINTFDGYGPIFSTQGGRSSCPHEKAELSYFYNNASYNPLVPTIPPLEEDQREKLSFATVPIEDPLISVNTADIGGVLDTQQAEFELTLENNGTAGTDSDFRLRVDNISNPNNAKINIEPNGTIVHVPYGQEVKYALTVEKSISNVFDYENINIILESLCDEDNINANVEISVHFVPTCTEVQIASPPTNWVYNINVSENADGSTNALPITMNGFKTTFDNFEKIDLQYRLASSPSWVRLHSYYKDVFYQDAVDNKEDKISNIGSATELSFNWDIVDNKLENGTYEIRAVSKCTNDTEFVSDIISGTIELDAPVVFGTPEPIDGILSAGEDLKVRFNENIFYNSAISKIEIKGATNQLPIKNDVSLLFEGESNTVTIEKPSIVSGDFSVEFWMNNKTTSLPAIIMSQPNGFEIGINASEELYWKLGTEEIKILFSDDDLFHHYTFTYKKDARKMAIYEDSNSLKEITADANLEFSSNETLTIGGNSFFGNIHDLRLWTKYLSITTAGANIYSQTLGNEKNLLGYWSMHEGRGTITRDLARFKHGSVNASWDIKPKGQSYDFKGDQALILENMGFAVITSDMDATISFWLKTNTTQNATIFSNGRGDGTDINQADGFDNKWALDINTSGNLILANEGKNYELTNSTLVDDQWHHITILLNRHGALQTLVDGQQVSSNSIKDITGFKDNIIWIGARGQKDLAGAITFDQFFTGNIDEFRIWNTLRNKEQVVRDQYNEIDAESIGLLGYARMNTPLPGGSPETDYFHVVANNDVIKSKTKLNTGTTSLSEDTPAIQPERSLIKFRVQHTINQDEMIISPEVSDFASLEGQILDITVDRMFDKTNNQQASPITWTAFVRINEMSWFVDGYDDIVSLQQEYNTSETFEITIINKGGKKQPFEISNFPNWLQLSETSGILDPDSKITIIATIDETLSVGEYQENLTLNTDYNYDEKLSLNVRVLAPAPDWSLDPSLFDYSMNVVGRVKLDGFFSADPFNKVAAFHNDELRGFADLVYDSTYKEYFVFLTIYSNSTSGEELSFKVWDANQGRLLEASLNDDLNISFISNDVIGSLSQPGIFSNTNLSEQDITLKNGWTWISFSVNSPNFDAINTLTSGLDLETSNLIKSHSPAYLDAYYKDTNDSVKSGWSGTISANGGMNADKMYKVRLSKEQVFNVRGDLIALDKWRFEVKENWNWLPYPLLKNVTVNEALALFDAEDGDVIKSQNQFAIYDQVHGWKGNLKSMVKGNGYMLKASTAQTYRYPLYFTGKRLAPDAIANTNVANAKEIDTDQFSRYPENMNAIVSIPKGYSSLYVYNENSNLVGIGSPESSNSESNLFFVTIYGETLTKLNFYLGKEDRLIKNSYLFNFASNSVLGTYSSPVVLYEEVQSTDLDTIYIFPNPFEEDINVLLAATKQQTCVLRLYTMSGKLAFSKEVNLKKGENKIQLSPNVSNGVYILKFSVDQNEIMAKIIKE